MPIEVGEVVVLNNIFFETAKAELKDESTLELEKLLNVLNKNPKLKLEISGHSDDAGNVVKRTTSATNMRRKLMEIAKQVSGVKDDPQAGIEFVNNTILGVVNSPEYQKVLQAELTPQTPEDAAAQTFIYGRTSPTAPFINDLNDQLHKFTGESTALAVSRERTAIDAPFLRKVPGAAEALLTGPLGR